MGKATTLRIELDGYWPPTPNDLDGLHWSRRKKLKDACAEWVRAFCPPGPLPAFEGPVLMLIAREWGYRQRALDPDNLEGSVKFLIDVFRRPGENSERMRRLGVIEDDRPECFIGGAPSVTQRKRPLPDDAHQWTAKQRKDAAARLQVLTVIEISGEVA